MSHTAQAAHPHPGCVEIPPVSTYLERGGAWASARRTLRDGQLNKGLGFTIKERQMLGLQGLLPPAVRSLKHQMQTAMMNIVRLPSDLDRYLYLMDLQDRNEKLFYNLVIEYVDNMLPLIYTPTVGLACQKYGLIFRRPRGLFISINDRGHVYDILCNWPESDVRAICVTDGERILGLGDLGALGMGIPVGKLGLYTACALVKPHQCLPITLDMGTNNEQLLKDPLYLGLRKTRATGIPYDSFIDEFMHAVARRFGHRCLIQFEDFGNQNAFRLLEKYRNHYCTFNDDIQGTAAVTVAGLIASTRVTQRDLKRYSFLFLGAGEAAIGIAKLLMIVLQHSGLTKEEAQDRIWLVDSKGLVVKDRPVNPVSGEKLLFAKNHPPVGTFLEAIDEVRPNALIGVSALAKAFGESALRKMAQFNDRPVIFALSNPTSKAECTAEEAYKFTEGRCVYASGSPAAPVEYNGVLYNVGQCNNAYIFPGLGLGIISCELRHVPEEAFLLAAQELAKSVTDKHLSEGRLFPELSEIHTISWNIAMTIVTWAYKHKMAGRLPEPINKEFMLRSNQYNLAYEDFTQHLYAWKDGEQPIAAFTVDDEDVY